METNTRLNWQDSPEQRLRTFRSFRINYENKTLEHCTESTLDFYSQIPIGSMSIDPYDINTWLNIWQMLHSNDFCEFNRALLYAYTLHYLGHPCEVQVGKTKNNHHMLCVIDDKVLNVEYNSAIGIDWLAQNYWSCEQKYLTTELCG